ncbi:hydrogenase accessory protein HypB [Asanoa ishikariensis]|uniref:Hydrogenase nickel incorporation protein HypB n=1 Tax=Asanoa ishikariensis TaxID=137265 RepID=A0A1H3TQK8_9ACTN|nr:hydrogenase nickel incorporation protein HypB [Asanoa ishikariensis]GIF61991.1 hydrogenase accessory protein HypB [Asanoa ishikariensis]SDZ52400.1 Hydrogenase nickel incorporation protein HypB [Asanoa ishikariensis]
MCGTCGCADSQSHSHEHVSLEQNVLAKNDAIARDNRAWLRKRDAIALNLMSSPGSGKTTLLERTLTTLARVRPAAVIEGDQATSLDAERLRRTGAPAVQVNTGAGCHLDAALVRSALSRLDPPNGAVVFVENVGNLVCPAMFDLGEQRKVVVISVTEGTDKPLKYPYMFAAADLVVINKIDLLPYVDFDVELCAKNARSVNPDLVLLTLSATTGEGLPAWYDWIAAQ